MGEDEFHEENEEQVFKEEEFCNTDKYNCGNILLRNNLGFMKKKKVILGLSFAVGIILLGSVCLICAFKAIGYERRIDLVSLTHLGRTPVRKDVILRYSKGWQLRTVFSPDQEADEGIVRLRIKNCDPTPLSIVLALNTNSISALSADFVGFRDSILPQEEKTIYEGKTSNLVGKIILINNERFMKTHFELVIDSQDDRSLKSPLTIFAYIPPQTI